MLRKRNKPAEGNGINLTPVLGVAFILVLFVAVGVPMARERGFDFSKGEWDGRINDCWPVIVVMVDSRNRVFVEDGDALKQVDVRAVQTNLRRKLLVYTRSCGVVVEAHPKSDMGIVMRVVDQAKKARNRPPVTVNVVTVG